MTPTRFKLPWLLRLQVWWSMKVATDDGELATSGVGLGVLLGLAIAILIALAGR